MLTLRQFCDDACNFVLIKIREVAPEWGCNLFSSDSTDFSEDKITNAQSCRSIDSDAWCKRP